MRGLIRFPTHAVSRAWLLFPLPWSGLAKARELWLARLVDADRGTVIEGRGPLHYADLLRLVERDERRLPILVHDTPVVLPRSAA